MSYQLPSSLYKSTHSGSDDGAISVSIDSTHDAGNEVEQSEDAVVAELLHKQHHRKTDSWTAQFQCRQSLIVWYTGSFVSVNKKTYGRDGRHDI